MSAYGSWLLSEDQRKENLRSQRGFRWSAASSGVSDGAAPPSVVDLKTNQNHGHDSTGGKGAVQAMAFDPNTRHVIWANSRKSRPSQLISEQHGHKITAEDSGSANPPRTWRARIPRASSRSSPLYHSSARPTQTKAILEQDTIGTPQASEAARERGATRTASRSCPHDIFTMGHAAVCTARPTRPAAHGDLRHRERQGQTAMGSASGTTAGINRKPEARGPEYYLATTKRGARDRRHQDEAEARQEGHDAERIAASLGGEPANQPASMSQTSFLLTIFSSLTAPRTAGGAAAAEVLCFGPE